MLAVIETHPVQYHAPVYRAVQQQFGIPVAAIYGSDFSVRGYSDPGFGATFAWDTDLLSGYSSEFLSEVGAGGAGQAEKVSPAGIREALARLRPAAVLVLGYSPRFHRVAWREARRTGARILFRGETTDHAAERSWLRTQLRRTALTAMYRTCDRILYIGEQSHLHYRRLGVPDDRLVFSPYCVDETTFDAGDAGRARLRSEARHELGIADDRLMVLYSGKLTAHKGVDLLPPAVRSLPQDLMRRLVLVFLGDGVRQPALEAEAAAEPALAVRFPGFQNQSRLSRYYHAADVLVLPSHAETWGLVVNEALLHGLPAVVSDRVGCHPDLVRPGETGRVFASGSQAALARALQAALPLVDREDVRRACRSRVSRYSVERAAAGIAAAFRAVVAAPVGSPAAVRP